MGLGIKVVKLPPFVFGTLWVCDKVYKPQTRQGRFKEQVWEQADLPHHTCEVCHSGGRVLKGGSPLQKGPALGLGKYRALPISSQNGALWRMKLTEGSYEHCMIAMRMLGWAMTCQISAGRREARDIVYILPFLCYLPSEVGWGRRATDRSQQEVAQVRSRRSEKADLNRLLQEPSIEEEGLDPPTGHQGKAWGGLGQGF